jgi:hypothetical protein
VQFSAIYGTLGIRDQLYTIACTFVQQCQQLTIRGQVKPPDYDQFVHCYYCDEYFDAMRKEGYEKHVLNKHPEKPCYPGLADIEKHSLAAKGMWWEI